MNSFRVGDERITSPKGRPSDGRPNPPARHLAQKGGLDVAVLPHMIAADAYIEPG